jgi:hypothetical protein
LVRLSETGVADLALELGAEDAVEQLTRADHQADEHQRSHDESRGDHSHLGRVGLGRRLGTEILGLRSRRRRGLDHLLGRLRLDGCLFGLVVVRLLVVRLLAVR